MLLTSSGSVRAVNRYVVSLDGSGDYTDINSAIQAVPSGSSWLILVREGVYDLNPNIRYPYKYITPKSHVTIRGEGVDVTIIRGFPEKQSAGSAIRAPVVYSDSLVEDFTIEDLTIVQNGSPDNMGWNAVDLRGENQGIVIRNVKITDVTGAAIAIRRFSNLLIENCILERAFTGITVLGGSKGTIQQNTIINMDGDGIFPQILSSTIPVYHLSIIDNYIENTGDTGIDITSNNQAPPHDNITARGNTLLNSHVRVSNALNVNLINNTVRNGKGWIGVDAGAGRPINILIEGNRVDSVRQAGIGLYGAENCKITGNQVNMLSPSPGTTQVGISAAVRGELIIEGNVINNPANYGIDFGNWALGDNHPIIRNNTILDFGDIGIYDNGKKQGPALIEYNTLYDSDNPFSSRYGIRTEYNDNKWTIRYNIIVAGSINAISAPSSTVYENSIELE